MKFTITSGQKKDFVFEVTDREVKIGRSRSNDVLLEDQSVSGCHARIFVEGDRVMLEDCESVNGIELNGKPVKKAALQQGDVITIGMTKITATDQVAAGTVETAEERKPVQSSSDLKNHDRTTRPRSRATKNVVAVLLILSIVALAFYLPRIRKARSAAASNQPSPTEYTRGVFRLRYEKVQASNQNIFRYEMRIENSAMTIAVDDLKQQRQLRPTKPLDPDEVGRIRDAIQDQQFFSLPSLIEGKSPDVWDASTLEVVSNGQTHRVRVINRLPPDNFKKACTLLEDWAEKELGILGFSMSTDELKKRSLDAFQRARLLYEQRSVKNENLYNAIKAYNEVIWYLDTIDPKPATYADAIHGKQDAATELNKQIEDHKFRAAKAIQLNEWRNAREELKFIMEKLPDPTDKRCLEARDQLLDIEKRIRSR